MQLQALSPLLAAILILAVGLSVVLRNRRHKVYVAFALFAAVVAAWFGAVFVYKTTGRAFYDWLAMVFAAAIPPAAIHFFRLFLAQPSIGGTQRGPRITWAWTILTWLVLGYSALFTPVHREPWFLVAFGLYVFGGLYRCIWDLYRQYRATTKRVERTRLWYLTLGGLVATTLALVEALPSIGIGGPALGNVIAILYLYFLSQALFRHRLLDINELVGKMAVLGLLVVLLWGVYGGLIAWVGTGGQEVFLVNAVVAAFVILILYEPLRSVLENSIHRWLLRQRNELRGRLEGLQRELSEATTIGDMVRRIILALEESQRMTDAGIYLLDSDGAAYVRMGAFGTQPVERFDVGADASFLDAARDGRVDTEALLHVRDGADDDARPALDALIARAQEAHCGLIVPLLGAGETEQGRWMLGFLAIRDDRANNAFDPDDMDLLRQLASQTARQIESTQAYERIKEKERLAALGEMAAGLAHEIRNPLGAIKGAAQLLMGPGGVPVEPSVETVELTEIIVEEANRLNNVLTRFLDYVRSERAPRQTAPTDINVLARRTAQLLGQANDRGAVEIRLRMDDQLPLVMADADQLLQVMLNLGTNALQAMPAGGTLELLTTRRRRSRLGYGQFVEVRFRDTGPGITEDKLRKLFIPFYTTKTKGTGLGLAISQRIVESHGGIIDARSTVGQGSTFSIFLPVAAAQHEHDDRRSPLVDEPN